MASWACGLMSGASPSWCIAVDLFGGGGLSSNFTDAPSIASVAFWCTDCLWVSITFASNVAIGGSSGIILMVTDTTAVAAKKLSTRQALTLPTASS